MKQFAGLVKGISGFLDKLAAVCIFSVMLLVVSNIVLRVGFNRPILGTYELVGFLTAVGVGLALAHCAFQDGHLAVSFIVERFPATMQAFIAVFIDTAALTFWGIAAWYLGKFGRNMMLKGLVSPSAEIPVYPFIYALALGLLGLCLVLLFKLVGSVRTILVNVSPVKFAWGLKVPGSVKRASK